MGQKWRIETEYLNQSEFKNLMHRVHAYFSSPATRDSASGQENQRGQ